MEETMMDEELIEQNVSSLLPPEIFVKIFTYSKNLPKLRLVCKRWQAITDGFFDMKVRINDDRMDVASIFKFKRVVQCTISKFVKDDISLLPPPSNKIFWDSGMLKSLTLRGPITKQNFLLLAKECSNVKELFLTGSLVNDEENLFTGSDEEKHVLTKFMSGLEKLVLSALHIDPSIDNPTSVNMHSLLNWRMDKLKTLVVRVNFIDAVAENKFIKMLKKFGSLESIEFTARNCFDTVVNTGIRFVLPNLCSLNIEVLLEERLRLWLPLLKAQTSIKYLKMVASKIPFNLDDEFMEAIVKNSKTLQKIELGILRSDGWGINLERFGEFDNLTNLVFLGDCPERPNLRNMNFLPESLKVLVLENVVVRRSEFERIAARTDTKTKSVYFTYSRD